LPKKIINKKSPIKLIKSIKTMLYINLEMINATGDATE
jgi:hypothetical protein